MYRLRRWRKNVLQIYYQGGKIMNRKKRGLALLLCICMLFTLMPMAAFADGTSSTGVVYGSYDTSGNSWTQDQTSGEKTYTNSDTGANVKYSKTAVQSTKGTDYYDITLKIESETNPGAAATVLVIDRSYSMEKCATCNNGSDISYDYAGYKHANDCATGNTGRVSTDDSRFAKAIDAAKSFASSYAASGSSRYLAVVFFAGSAEKVNFGTDRNPVYWLDVSDSSNLAKFNASLSKSCTSSTNMASGLNEARGLFDNSAIRSVNDDYKFTVALTDGANTQGGYTSWSEGKVTDDEAAAKAATSLKNATNSENLYAVCYSAGSTVYNFLKKDITGSDTRTFEANDTTALNNAFAAIVNSIKSGLSSGFTVTDPMGGMVTLQNSSLTDCTIDSDGTITWTPTTGTTETKDGETIYTYTLTYTVKLNTDDDDFVSNKYYPTNGNTTLSFKDGNVDQTLQFNVPGVKGTKPSYNVTYTYTGETPDGADASEYNRTGVTKNTTVTVPTPTADGWTFNGWTAKDADGNTVTITTDSKLTMPASDVTITGTWEKNPYKVTYEYTGTVPTGAPALPNSGEASEVLYGTKVSVAENPTLNGYTFSGWDTTSNGVTVGTDGKFTMPDNDVEFTGSWTARGDIGYKVEYYWIGDKTTLIADAVNGTGTFNETVTASGDQLKTIPGYTLIDSGTNYNPSVKLTDATGDNVIKLYYYKNVKLVADNGEFFDYQLPRTVNSFKAFDISGTTGVELTATFNGVSASGIANVGDTTANVKFSYDGDELTSANVASKKIVDTTGYYIVTEVVNGNITVIPTYQVIYKYANSDVVPTDKLPTLPDTVTGKVTGNTVTLATITAPDGYTFSGWKVQGTDTVVTSVTIANADITVVGTWEKQTGIKYTVNYYWNKTTDSVKTSYSDEATYGDVIKMTPPAVEGYTPVSTAEKSITISTNESENVITFYYYKNVALMAYSNGDTDYYDGTLQSVTGFAANVIPDETEENLENADKLFPQISAGVSGTNAGTYTSKFSLLDPIDDWTAAAPEDLIGQTDINYQYYVVSAKEGKLTIAKRPVTLTSETASKPYDGTPLTRPDVVIGGEGFVTGEVVADSIKATGTIMYPASVQGTGSVENTIVYETTGKFNADNYKITEYPGTLSITDRGTPLDPNNPNEIVPKYNVSIVALDDSKVYNGQLQFADKGFTVNGTTNADNSGDTVFTAENSLNYTISNVKASGEGKDVNDDGYPIKIVAVGEGYKIVDKYGVDVTNQFEIRTTPGKLTITPIDGVKVTIKGHTDTVQYDGKEHIVTGYDISADNALFDISEVDYRGTAEAKGTNVDTYPMNLKDEGFSYTGNNFENVKFVVTDGWLKIESKPVIDTGIYTKITVKITGNSASEVYDGTEKSVEGYTVEISDPRYTEKDFKFTGTAEAKGTYVGEYPMGLEADQFVNINRRFKNVEFIIVEDGVLTITARPITITAGSAEGWVTDCPITCDEWTSTPPAPGDTVVSVKVTGSQNGPGSSPNVPSDAVIENAAGKDVTDNYDITYVNGVLTAIDLLEKEDHFNYVIGYPDGSVQPNGNITRAEVATIFYRLLTDDARAKYATTSNSFSDIKTGEWYTKAISTLENAGIIGGYPDGTFKPNASITRAEMATIIAKFASLDANGKTFTDIKGHWAQSYIELAAGNGWINGYEDGTFRPDKNITRAETFAMINRVLERQVASADDLLPTSQMNMWTDNLNAKAWYYVDVQEATNYHKCDRVNESAYETWTEKVPDIDWAKHQI